MVQQLLDACNTQKNDYQVAVLALDFKSYDCAKHVRVLAGPPFLGKVCKCVLYLCVRRGSKYFKVVSGWLILVADLYGTILVGGPLWTQFDDIVVLAIVFFALISHSIGFQIFGNLKDIPLIGCSFSSE